jgi:hypothetical protein
MNRILDEVKKESLEREAKRLKQEDEDAKNLKRFVGDIRIKDNWKYDTNNDMYTVTTDPYVHHISDFDMKEILKKEFNKEVVSYERYVLVTYACDMVSNLKYMIELKFKE